jgi:hypothetical protein
VVDAVPGGHRCPAKRWRRRVAAVARESRRDHCACSESRAGTVPVGRVGPVFGLSEVAWLLTAGTAGARGSRRLCRACLVPGWIDRPYRHKRPAACWRAPQPQRRYEPRPPVPLRVPRSQPRHNVSEPVASPTRRCPIPAPDATVASSDAGQVSLFALESGEESRWRRVPTAGAVAGPPGRSAVVDSTARADRSDGHGV